MQRGVGGQIEANEDALKMRAHCSEVTTAGSHN